MEAPRRTTTGARARGWEPVGCDRQVSTQSASIPTGMPRRTRGTPLSGCAQRCLDPGQRAGIWRPRAVHLGSLDLRRFDEMQRIPKPRFGLLLSHAASISGCSMRCRGTRNRLFTEEAPSKLALVSQQSAPTSWQRGYQPLYRGGTNLLTEGVPSWVGVPCEGHSRPIPVELLGWSSRGRPAPP